MNKITLRIHNALKSTLQELASANPQGVLVYGINNLTQDTFCKKVDIMRCIKRLLSCTRVEIKALGHYPLIEESFVTWLKNHIRTPVTDFCNLASAHNWLKYNINSRLNCLKLSVGKVDYYMILREEWLIKFRESAFKK